MTDRKTKLILESALNQVYSNDNLYDGSVTNFTFYNVNYVYLNDVYLYPRGPIKIIMDHDYMIFNMDSMSAEITYANINDFVINIKEEKNV